MNATKISAKKGQSSKSIKKHKPVKEEFITKDSEKKDIQRKRKSTTVNQDSKNSRKIKKERK